MYWPTVMNEKENLEIAGGETARRHVGQYGYLDEVKDQPAVKRGRGRPRLDEQDNRFTESEEYLYLYKTWCLGLDK